MWTGQVSLWLSPWRHRSDPPLEGWSVRVIGYSGSDGMTDVMCHWCVCVRACSGSTCDHTFLNDTSLVIQHALHLTASHVCQARLLHKGLAPVEACAVGQVGPHCDQEANVVLPQTYSEKRLERKVRYREQERTRGRVRRVWGSFEMRRETAQSALAWSLKHEALMIQRGKGLWWKEIILHTSSELHTSKWNHIKGVRVRKTSVEKMRDSGTGMWWQPIAFSIAVMVFSLPQTSLYILCSQQINVFWCWQAVVNIIYSPGLPHRDMKTGRYNTEVVEAAPEWDVFTETWGHVSRPSGME